MDLGEVSEPEGCACGRQYTTVVFELQKALKKPTVSFPQACAPRAQADFESEVRICECDLRLEVSQQTQRQATQREETRS